MINYSILFSAFKVLEVIIIRLILAQEWVIFLIRIYYRMEVDYFVVHKHIFVHSTQLFVIQALIYFA